MSLGQLDDLVTGFEDAAGALDDLLAGGGERHALGCPLDELHAQVVLQLLELRRQGGLAHEASFGRAAEMAGVGHRHEVSQVLELEVRHRCSLWSLSNQSIGRNGVCPGEFAPTKPASLP